MAFDTGGGGGLNCKHQRDSDDRCAAGAADRLHGHYAGDAEGSRCPGAAATEEPQKQQDNDRTIVVQVTHRPGGGVPGYKINEMDVSHGDLLNKLEGIFATRAEKVMFVKGDPELDFSAVADVLDIGHEAGVDHIGLITPKVAAGQ